MKKKIGTILDEELVFKAKQIALSQKQPLSKLLEDALNMYLLILERKKLKGGRHISQSTRGSMKISKEALKPIMEEESIYEIG